MDIYKSEADPVPGAGTWQRLNNQSEKKVKDEALWHQGQSSSSYAHPWLWNTTYRKGAVQEQKSLS